MNFFRRKAPCCTYNGILNIYSVVCFCFLICFINLATVGCSTRLFNRDRPVATLATIEVIDASQEPQQLNTNIIPIFTIKGTKGSFTVTTVAEYRITAMIVAIKEYSSGWNSQISPVDLALAWGGLAKVDYDTYIEYEQRGRWYYYKYNNKSPFDGRYITSHSENNHIIPATENLKKILATLKVKQTVLLEGYLVNVTGVYDGKEVWWNSSLSREDNGDGSCELIYVKKIVVNGFVYE